MLRLLLLVFIVLSVPIYAKPINGFVAKYDVYYGDYNLGTGRYELEHIKDEQYKFSFESKMRFFLVFTDKRWIETEFKLKNNQILPIRYAHKREGTGPDYNDVIEFDVAGNQIRSMHKNDAYEQDYDALIRDGLSVQLQLVLDLRRGVENPKYLILDENKLKEREFEFIKEETLEIEGQEYQTVLYQVVRDSGHRKTQMWFSVKHDYQPVMMAHFNKEKKRFNARITSYTEEKPAVIALNKQGL